MKILCVIDHFGSGGAQRQMVELACGLKHRGHAVEIFIYFPQHDFFRSRVISSEIPVHEYQKGRGFSPGVVKALSSLINAAKFDIVLSYLDSPNVYAEISKLIHSTPKLVVSERSSHQSERSPIDTVLRRALHRLADHVVTNSLSHKRWLEHNFSWLRGKVACIYNGLNINDYEHAPNVPKETGDLRLLAVGRIGPEKNAINLLKGCDLYYQVNHSVPWISWVGRRDNSPAGKRYYEQVDKLLDSLPEVKKKWQWLGERTDIPSLLRAHHALIHPSFYEGLPNIVCEALAAGRPVLVSDVCDHSMLVANGERGFLFDPHNPETISKCIGKLASLKQYEWMRFSCNARQYAELFLTSQRMVSEYEGLFSILSGKPL